MSMSEDSKQKAWLEYYQRLVNVEFYWDPDHLLYQPPVEGPPIPITIDMVKIDWLCWSLTTLQPLRVILCRLPEKGRKEIEERVEEMKERNREERGTGMKVKKQKK